MPQNKVIHMQEDAKGRWSHKRPGMFSKPDSGKALAMMTVAGGLSGVILGLKEYKNVSKVALGFGVVDALCTQSIDHAYGVFFAMNITSHVLNAATGMAVGATLGFGIVAKHLMDEKELPATEDATRKLASIIKPLAIGGAFLMSGLTLKADFEKQKPTILETLKSSFGVSITDKSVPRNTTNVPVPL